MPSAVNKNEEVSRVLPSMAFIMNTLDTLLIDVNEAIVAGRSTIPKAFFCAG